MPIRRTPTEDFLLPLNLNRYALPEYCTDDSEMESSPGGDFVLYEDVVAMVKFMKLKEEK